MSLLSVVKEKGVEIILMGLVTLGYNLVTSHYQVQFNTAELHQISELAQKGYDLSVSNNTDIAIVSNKVDSLERLHTKDVDRLEKEDERIEDRVYNQQGKIGHDKYGNLVEKPPLTAPIPTIK